MKKFLPVLLIIFVLLTQEAHAQKLFPANYFRPPLDIPMYLSGTFGELRSNHFHAGIDIKTQGVEGLKVYAVAEGYVSRVKVGLGGYGSALYITHPNGYISVYGHLKKFNKAITQYVRKNQYKRKSFTVDLYPDKGLLKVNKGDVIALSGNTGGSMGPHLHFELRDAANQHPINPLLFKSIKISDDKSPVIAGLAVYPIGDSSCVNNLNDTLFFKVVASKRGYILQNDKVLNVGGKVAFGLRAYDRMNKTHNKNGIYREQLFIDSVPVFDIRMDELSFYTSRYINSFIDYRYFQKKKRRLIRTELDTNNRLNIYRIIKDNGIFTFDDTLTHYANYVVKDAYGNSSTLFFKLKGCKTDTVMRKRQLFPKGDSLVQVQFSVKTEVDMDGFTFTLPANALYSSQVLNFSRSPGNDNTYADVFTVGNRFVPLQKYSIVSLPLSKNVADSLTSKLYVAKLNEDGQTDFAGGEYKEGMMVFKTRMLGKYTIMADTIPPVIKWLNGSDGNKITNQKSLKFKITDKPTGIKKYAAFLNDKWILMEYNPKKSLLTYRFDWLLKKGKNHLKLYVFDNCDNETVFETDLIY